MPWADGALPDTESGLGWGVNWVVRSPEAMGGKLTDGDAAERMQHLSEAAGRCRREGVGGHRPKADTHIPVFRF